MATHAFVTGASGKVASVLIPRLIEAGHTVTGMVRTEAKAAAVRAHGATCVVGDLANPGADGGHCWFDRATCAGQIMLEPNWVDPASTAPFALGPNADWLAAAVTR